MSVTAESKGFLLGEVAVPAFVLRTCEWIVLDWPDDIGSKSERNFYSALRGEPPCSSLLIYAKLAILDAMPQQSQAVAMLRSIDELFGMLGEGDQEDLRQHLSSRNILRNTPIAELPLTTRMFAGGLLACKSSDLVVFNTSGLDPLGVQFIYSLFMQKLAEGLSLIEIRFPQIGTRVNHPMKVRVIQVSCSNRQK